MRLFRDPKKFIVFLLICSLIVLFYLLDLKSYLTLSSLKTNFEALKSCYEAHPGSTAAVFMGVFILMSALALPGPLILCLAAGALFGVFTGTFYVTLAATTGSSLAFLATRYLFAERIQRKFGKRLAAVNTLLEKEGFYHLLLIRLIPIVPFTLINIGAGLTKIPLRTFMAATFIGIIPPGLILCNAGANLASIRDVREILSIRVLGSILLLGIFPLAAICRRAWLRKRVEQEERARRDEKK